MEPALSCSPERVGRGSSAAVEPMLRSIRFARDSSMDRLHAIELAAVCADPCISQRSAIRHGLLLLESIAVSYQRRRRVGVVHGQEWHPSAGLHPHQDLELQRCSADEYSRRRTVGSSGASADADRSIPSHTPGLWARADSVHGATRFIDSAIRHTIAASVSASHARARRSRRPSRWRMPYRVCIQFAS